MTFLYPFLTFLQPGMLWPALVDLRPNMIAGAVGLLFGLLMRSTYSRASAFGGRGFVYLALFIFVQMLSVYYAGVYGMLEELSFWGPYLLFVVVSILLMPDTRQMNRYVWGMIVGAMFIVFYGIYAVPAWGGYEGTGRAGAYGMYDNHNDYSFIIIQVLPFIYMFRKIESGRARRLLLLGCMAACVVGMGLSLSRGGMIALVLEAALIIVIGMEGRRRLWLLPVIAVIGAVAISYQYAKRAENQGDRYTAEDAESSRFELWRAGQAMFLDKPILGVGSRRFYEYSGRYYDLSHDQKGKNSHNTFLEIATGSGLLGLITFLLAGKNISRELRRVPRQSLPPVLDAVRKATLIGMYTLALRAFLDAKTYDWSFYTLGALGIACYLLIRVEESKNASIAAPNSGERPATGAAVPFGQSFFKRAHFR